MRETDWLAERFEEHRGRLTAVAYRMLGSRSEAEDAVQEAWLRLDRSDTSEVENLGSWLTTVVSRVCLNTLEQRRSHPAVALAPESLDAADPTAGVDPESEALLADSIGLALLGVLDALSPAERVAFVLHDMFAVPFVEIAPIIGRKPAAARQLASRARRRVQGQTNSASDLRRQSELVEAFLAAARQGDLDGLLAVLDPEIVLRGDETAVKLGAKALTRGAAEVAATFAGRARGAVPAFVNGAAGAAWIVAGRPRVVFSFTIVGDRIAAIDLIADEELLRELDLRVLERERSERRSGTASKPG